MNWTLELIVLPVTDVDRAKSFYEEQLDFNVDVEIVSETAPEEVRSRTRGEEGGRASSLSADNTLRLTALSDNETEVFYASEAAVVGRLAKFGLGVMKKKAESLAREFAQAFKNKVEQP